MIDLNNLRIERGVNLDGEVVEYVSDDFRPNLERGGRLYELVADNLAVKIGSYWVKHFCYRDNAMKYYARPLSDLEKFKAVVVVDNN